jgi:hypothetical protein
MDKKFRQQEAVQALDTNTGTWREATIRLLSALTVTILFPAFAAGKNTLTETISEEAVRFPSTWPIRKREDPKPEALDRRTRRRAGVKLPYEPSNRILDDVVSKF